MCVFVVCWWYVGGLFGYLLVLFLCLALFAVYSLSVFGVLVVRHQKEHLL